MKHIYKHLIVFAIAVGIIFLSMILKVFANEVFAFIGIDFRFITSLTGYSLYIHSLVVYFVLFYWLNADKWFKSIVDVGPMCSGSSCSDPVSAVPTLRHQHEQIYILTHIIGLEGVNWKSKDLANKELYKLLEQEFILSSSVNGALVSPKPESDTLPENQA